jgi:hypothetical protein
LPPEQVADECGSEQAVAQSPQCIGSVWKLVSQPFDKSASQSPLPSRQVNAQTRFVQVLLEQSVSALQP